MNHKIKSDSEFITIRNSSEFDSEELSGYKKMEHTSGLKIEDNNSISQSQVIERAVLKNKNIADCEICFTLYYNK